MSDQVHEPATMPATREEAVAGEIAERSSTHCTMAELSVDLGLLEVEGVFEMDFFADLPPLLSPLSELPVSLGST
ncbi:hypothetical protein M9458_028309, partial [Cirrhinus mrigala]